MEAAATQLQLETLRKAYKTQPFISPATRVAQEIGTQRATLVEDVMREYGFTREQVIKDFGG